MIWMARPLLVKVTHEVLMIAQNIGICMQLGYQENEFCAINVPCREVIFFVIVWSGDFIVNVVPHLLSEMNI